MKNSHKTPLAIAMGATLLPLAINVAQADSNPFALADLGAGYMLTAEATPAQGATDKMKDGSCGEGKCGAAMMKPSAAQDKKAIEGKCATNKPAAPAADSANKPAAK